MGHSRPWSLRPVEEADTVVAEAQANYRRSRDVLPPRLRRPKAVPVEGDHFRQVIGIQVPGPHPRDLEHHLHSFLKLSRLPAFPRCPFVTGTFWGTTTPAERCRTPALPPRKAPRRARARGLS